jgi:NitT/TauT family transport system substrate-binding protein
MPIMPSCCSCVRQLLYAGAFLLLPGSMLAHAADAVRVGVGAVYPTYAVFFAGNQLGIYKKHDLDVQITTFRGGPATQEALAAGSIDISAIAPAVVDLAIKKGVREQIVALFTPPVPDGWFIMVPKASPAKTMADLNGKTVGVTQKVSLTDYWANRAASISGITINTIPLGGGVVPGVKAKQVDAGIIWPIYSYKAMAEGTLRPVFSLSEKLPPSISEGVAVSQDMIDKHPDVLKRWLAATSETISTMQADEARAEELLKDYFKEDNLEVLKSVYKDFIMHIRPDGIMKKEWMEESLKAAEFFGDKEPLSPDKIFSTAFTPVQAK